MKIFGFNKDTEHIGLKENDYLLGYLPESVAIFSKDEEDDFIRKVKDSNEDKEIILVIVHRYSYIKNRCDEEWKDKNIVLINCSSDGRKGKCHIEKNKLKILELQPDFQILDEPSWVKIIEPFKKKPSIVDEIIKGEIPNNLKQFFGQPISISILHVISILCQGYLAVHSDIKGNIENIDGDTFSQIETDEIITALQNIFGSGTKNDFINMLPSPFNDSTSKGREARDKIRQRVREPSFWEPCTKHGSSQLDDLSSIKQDWEQFYFNGQWEKVIDLIELLKNEKTPGNHVDVVAGAFNQLQQYR